MTAQQLKNSILQMAVQGKLVPQDPNDEPASALLERIRAEKGRLIKEKKIKREKNPSVIFKGADNTPYEKIGDEVHPLDTPFDIPESWEWVRHNDLFEISGGSQPPKSKFISEARDGYIRLYQIRDYGNTQFPSTYPLALRRRFRKKVISSLHGMVHPSAKSFGLRMVHTMSLWLVSFLYMKLS